jgi:uncharacterized membrane protein
LPSMPPDLPAMAARTQYLQRAALACYVLLIFLTLLWEGWLAPAPKAPPGFWLALKGILLLLPLFGMLRNKLRSYLLASLLVMLYFMEGTMLLYLHRMEDFALHSVLPYALLETLLTLGFIASAGFYVGSARAAGAQV